MRREDRVTVQGPVKEQQPDGMSHGGDPFPKTPFPPPQTKVTIVGKNEIYNRVVLNGRLLCTALAA